jgi:hypothetical protein
MSQKFDTEYSKLKVSIDSQVNKDTFLVFALFSVEWLDDYERLTGRHSNKGVIDRELKKDEGLNDVHCHDASGVQRGGGGWGSANAPPIFFLPQNSFFGY